MNARTLVAGLGVLTGLGLGAPSHAQSKRYPAAPVDKDAEDATRSKLWAGALNPDRQPYQNLVQAAKDALGQQRTQDQVVQAIAKLDEAIQLQPRAPEAYRLRGELELDRRDWAKCAADLAAADAYARRDDEPAKPVAEPGKSAAELRRKLGICQARAGKLSEAERTLAETAASGNGSTDVWTRLGEVRIAMGKLDEAIAALRSALDASDAPAQATVHFMLAAAYDRARRPADAMLELATAVRMDPQLNVLHNPTLPALGPGELDYMLGLAYSADLQRPDPPRPDPQRAESLPRPEYTLAYFRRFVAAAPSSPWRKRADEHIRELRTSELPDAIVRGGTAPLDLDAARAATRKIMPQMRACLAKSPMVVVEVEISHAGPRTPPTDRMRPRFFMPPDGVTVRRSLGEISEAAFEAVDRCLQPLAARLPLPPPKERDTYYKATFYVVGP